MTYFEEAFPEGRKSGTIYGVPYQYSLERDRYTLPDGTCFNGEDFGSLRDYVAANLAKFSDTVLGKKAHNDMMDAITYSMTNQHVASTITAEKLVKDMKNAIKTMPPPDPGNFLGQSVLDSIRARRKTERELDDLNMERWEVSKRNAKIQKEWDKAFQAEVVKLVRIAMETGQAKVTYMAPIAQEVHTLGGPTATTVMGREMRMAAVTYNSWMPTEMEAYRDVREQAENVVRLTMKPPDLHPLP